MSAPEVCYSYNLATPTERHLTPAQAYEQVREEIRAILSTGPLFLVSQEAIGYRSIHVPGYTELLDKSTEGRANERAWVRDGEPLKHVGWLDQKTTWPKTQHGGTHPARSFLHFSLDHLLVLDVHQLPKNAATVVEGQREGIDALTRHMAPWTVRGQEHLHPLAHHRATIALGDYNRTALEKGSTPQTLANAIGGLVVNREKIDTAVVRNLAIRKVDYPTEVAGVQLHSDHKHALRVTFAR